MSTLVFFRLDFPLPSEGVKPPHVTWQWWFERERNFIDLIRNVVAVVDLVAVVVLIKSTCQDYNRIIQFQSLVHFSGTCKIVLKLSAAHKTIKFQTQCYKKCLNSKGLCIRTYFLISLIKLISTNAYDRNSDVIGWKLIWILKKGFFDLISSTLQTLSIHLYSVEVLLLFFIGMIRSRFVLSKKMSRNFQLKPYHFILKWFSLLALQLFIIL